MITGNSTCVGHRSILTQMPMSGRLSSHQQQVAHPHRGDQAPEQLRLVVDDVRARGDAVDDERADHQRHHRVGGQAEGEQRDERRLRGGVVGRLGAGDALDDARAELLRLASRAASRRRTSEVASTCPPPGSTPSARPRPVPRRTGPRCGGSRRGSARGPPPSSYDRGGLLVLQVAHDLGDAEEADRERDEVEAAVELAHPEGEARHAGEWSWPIVPSSRPSTIIASALTADRGERDARDQAEDDEREVVGRAELQRQRGQGRGRTGRARWCPRSRRRRTRSRRWPGPVRPGPVGPSRARRAR